VKRVSLATRRPATYDYLDAYVAELPQVVDLEAGDISFIPRAYFHHIEVLDEGPGIRPLPGGAALEPQDHRQRRLALAQVGAEALADRRLVAREVETVVDDLEGHAEVVAVGAQRLDELAQLDARARIEARIAAEAHHRAMRACRPGMMEYEIEAELMHEFRRCGAQAPAYSPIVAGGANACILHYVGNSQPLRDGDLLLIDAGCELDGYASDITRTGIFGAKPTDRQAKLETASNVRRR